VRYVLPASAPPAAFAEVDRLKGILGAGRTISTLDGLLDEMDSAAFGILHFAAHNVGAGSDPASAYVKLDKPFLQAMLGTDRPGLFQDASPLVFMNACNSGAASPMWVGSTGWAGRFLSAGAGAFVGSLWQVRDKPAKDFAECFYDKLQAGEALGAAFQAARLAVFKPGDPTRLGYILFGHTAATLARKTREASHE
jgi:CHAT domain-containing protein